MNQASTWKPTVKRLESGERDRLKAAKGLLRKKQYEEALTEFEAVLEKNTQSISALLGIGLIHLRQKAFDEALMRFKQAKALDPLQPKPYLLEGVALLRLGHLDEAQHAFESALSLDARSHRALFGLGEVLLNKKRYQEALSRLREALRYNPQWTAPRFLITKLYAEQEKHEEAIRELQAILEIDTAQTRASIQMARLYASQKMPEKAAGILKAAMTKTVNDNGSAYLKMGLVANELKLYDIAENAFRSLLASQPNRLIVQLYLIEAMIGNGKFDEAEAALRKLPLNKQYGGLIHKLLGDIYYQRGQFRIAVEEYRATVLSIPDLAEQAVGLLDDGDDNPEDEWESLADHYQPSLANVLAEQTDRLREVRARRRNAH